MFTPQQLEAQEKTRVILAQQHDALGEVEDRWTGRGAGAGAQPCAADSEQPDHRGKASAPAPMLTPKTGEEGGTRKASECAARLTKQAGLCDFYQTYTKILTVESQWVSKGCVKLRNFSSLRNHTHLI
eukprot:2865713-Rhodomonas_salina.1